MSAKLLNVFAEKDLLERSVKVSISVARCVTYFSFLHVYTKHALV